MEAERGRGRSAFSGVGSSGMGGGSMGGEDGDDIAGSGD